MNPVDYNKLPLVATAAKRFEEQLDDNKITREDLFSEIAPLFQAPENQAFGVCLVYRHYRLQKGERIVTNGDASSPSTDTSSSILAERWLSTGAAFQYRLADGASSLTPPSSAFFSSFRAILKKYNINTLGVCYAPSPNSVPLLQIAGTGDRQQSISVSTAVFASSFGHPKVYEASWNPTSNECTMACDESFSVRKYNTMISIADADQAFDEQLDQSPDGPITREELFSKLAPLFVDSDGKPGPYAVFLVHRHHKLNNGERMVTFGNTTRPATELAETVPERWFSTGEEFEHRSTAGGVSLAPGPSPDLLAAFKKIVDEQGINILGVAFAPDIASLPPNHVFLERTGPGDREQIVTQVHEDEVQGPDIYQSSWVPTVDSATLSCHHNCQNCLQPLVSPRAAIEEAVKVN